MHQANRLQHENFLERKHFAVSRIVVRAHNEQMIATDFINSLNSLNYSLIDDLQKIKSFLTQKDVALIHSKNLTSGENVSIYLFNEHHYILISHQDKLYLLQDATKLNLYNPVIIVIFFAILSLFVLIYLTTIRKLYPLKVLKNHIKKLGNESFDINYTVKRGDDEISELALEFAKSSKRLQQLKESRNIFIRNIMHELKTPIMKGKLLTELPKNEQNIQRMKDVFYRLENLINEFASIEEIIASSKKLECKPYSLEDVIDNAKDMLLYEESSNQIIYEHAPCLQTIDLNFKLFSIAVKNLIDNAIKHSADKEVKIVCKEDSVTFINKGDKLQQDLEKYFEPFYKENSTTGGFGLGLYIVHKILKAHRFDLQYSFKDGCNFFKIVF